MDNFGLSQVKCSVANSYLHRNIKTLAQKGMTEADVSKALPKGQWGVYQGGWDNIPHNTLLFEGQFTSPYGGSLVDYQFFKTGNLIKVKKPLSPDTDIIPKEQMEAYLDSDKWNIWLPGQEAPVVSSVSKSIGHMSDEDIATMFVKTKDEVATAKGINIKGANPQLDQFVYDAIGSETGYTAAEVKGKIDAYKATGKKLSALKKKVVPKKAPKMEPVVLEELDYTAQKYYDAWKKEIDEGELTIGELQNIYNSSESKVYKTASKKLLDDIKAKPVDDLAAKVAKKKADLKKMEDSEGFIDSLQLIAENPGGAFPEVSQLAAKELLNELKSKIPLQAGEDVVKAAVKDVMDATPTYLDEDVAKAYIKAKDQVVSNDHNPWTLYTQNVKEMDEQIFKLMDQAYGINLSPNDIKKQVAKYLSEGNKLSVLKKKMAKTGEYEPKAPTLKKKKGDPTGSGKTSKTQAQKDIADAADAGYLDDASDFVMDANLEQSVYMQLQGSLYAGLDGAAVYERFEQLLNQVSSLSAWDQGKKKPNILQLVRAYDKLKAKQLGIPNGNFYEKKLVEYAASPTGKAKIQAAKQAKQLEENLPPLPADSSSFLHLSSREASEMQANQRKWTPDERNGLREYTGAAYRDMNTALRRGVAKTNAYWREIQAAQKAMQAVPQQFLVTRGCDFAQFGLGSYEQALQLIGKTVQDKGFLSTSVGQYPAFSGSVRLQIEIPQGTHGSYVDDISMHRGEEEFLVAAGTKYQVLRVTKNGYQTEIRLRAIPGSHTAVKDLE